MGGFFSYENNPLAQKIFHLKILINIFFVKFFFIANIFLTKNFNHSFKIFQFNSTNQKSKIFNSKIIKIQLYFLNFVSIEQERKFIKRSAELILIQKKLVILNFLIY